MIRSGFESAMQAHAALEYNPDTGVFVWKVKPRKSISAGDVAGGATTNGYWTICYRGKAYLAHRLAWLMTYGEWPPNGIDHVNGNRSDNRLCNLRLCNQSQNNANQRVRSDNTSGVKGVYWHKKSGRWQVRVGNGGRCLHVGMFVSKSEAIEARAAAAEKHFGQFARH